MPLLALIVSADNRDVDVLQEVMRELHVQYEVCGTVSIAKGELMKKSFDALILDGELPGVLEMVDDLARRGKGEDPRIIAILGSKECSERAFEIGAHFVLYKPVSRDRSLVSLEYAFRSAGKDRRNSDRRGVYVSTTVTSPVVEDAPVTLLNLSPSGTALQSGKRLPPDSRLYFHFQIPGQDAAVRLSGNVVWQDIQGRAGIRFASVPASSRKALEQWLERVDRDALEEPPEVSMDVERFGPLDTPGDRDPQPVVIRQKIELPVARQERRAQSRYSFDAGVRVSDLGTAIPNWCNIADISLGGCYIEMVVPFPKATILNLELRTGDLRLQTRGRVKSSLPGKGMGVQFEISGEEQRQQLHQILEFLAAGASLRST
jgi:CheY-like chemotaxis protein